MENIQKFYDALTKDEAMRERLTALNEKYGDGKPEEAVIAAEIVAFAATEGFPFTADEYEAYVNTEGKELSDEQLASVAGGVYDSGSCKCLVGGGGKDNETGTKCACVIGGGGKKDRKGRYLMCVGFGVIQD